MTTRFLSPLAAFGSGLFLSIMASLVSRLLL